MQEKEKEFLICLHHFLKFGPRRINRLHRFFKSYKSAFNATYNGLVSSKIEEKIAAEFIRFRQTNSCDKILSGLQKFGIKTVACEENEYPARLKEIPDNPPLLYYKGTLPDPDSIGIAIVGSRKNTAYGKMAAGSIAAFLSRSRLNIISGLALGIDTLAHIACLDAGGMTAAVIGSGLDDESIYPRQNLSLAERIIASGGVIFSEFPPGTQALKHYFPMRNRLIAGMSLACVVVEAAERSGALITARCALDYDREVFAVPGSIFSAQSRGTNNLIRQGASLAGNGPDILESLNLSQIPLKIKVKKIIPATPEEGLIAGLMAREPMHIDHIIRCSGLDTNLIISTLTVMEMKGMIRNVGGMEYIIIN